MAPFLAGGLVQGNDGNFYGTTNDGGLADEGTIFVITPTGTLTTLDSCSDSSGSFPYAGLLLGTDGNFYGTTQTGGSGNEGTVFKMIPTGFLTVLHSFINNGVDGYYLQGGVVQGRDPERRQQQRRHGFYGDPGWRPNHLGLVYRPQRGLSLRGAWTGVATATFTARRRPGAAPRMAWFFN